MDEVKNTCNIYINHTSIMFEKKYTLLTLYFFIASSTLCFSPSCVTTRLLTAGPLRWSLITTWISRWSYTIQQHKKSGKWRTCLVSRNTFMSMKWNELGFRPLLCTYRINWARITSWGWCQSRYLDCLVYNKKIKRSTSLHINSLTGKLFNWNFHPLEVVSRWRDPQLQVGENYLDLTKWRSTILE